MIRNLKALGLMAVAALAMSAMFASAAQANNNGTGTYTCGKTATPNVHTTCNIHGEQYGTIEENFFEAGAEKIHCPNSGVTYTSHSANGTSADLTVTPHYKDCTTSSNLPLTVTMNGCFLTLTRPTTTGGTPKWDATVDLKCPAGVVGVDIHIYLFGTPTSHSVQVCTMTVFPKNNMTGLTAEAGTKAGKDDLTVKTNITAIKYEKSGSCGAETAETGILKSNITVTAKNAAGEADDLWLSHKDA
jgi:hypothetical protein